MAGSPEVVQARLLWSPSNIKSTKTWQFKQHIENKFQLQFADYEALRQWSISNINDFWTEVWHFTGIRASSSFTKVQHASRSTA
jgi:acetoacetyl-CoA synthetase